jgi:predicted N-acetyltransferase YhbS
MGGYPIGLLSPKHDLEQFESGSPEHDRWLKRRALAHQQEGSARVYVAARRGHVVGYVAVSAASVEPVRVPRRGKGRAAIPVILIARLAVDVVDQGNGLGAALLIDALGRASRAADQIGALAVIAHAPDQDARSFCEHFGFASSPSDAFHLLLRVVEIRRVTGKRRPEPR